MINSPIDEIKNRLDITDIVREYVKLEKSGINYRALCPFHSEKTPSFFVNPSRQIWRCFGGCSEGGDIFKFIMKIEGVEFGDALRILASKAGIELKKQDPKLKTERQKIYEICEWSARFFEKQLKEGVGKEAKKYLLERGISEESIGKWRIGYAPESWDGLILFLVGKGYKREEVAKSGLAARKDDRFYNRFRGRIMFPVFDFNSQPVGFGGRIFDPAGKKETEAKYLNTPNTLLYDKSKILYGMNLARSEIRKKDCCILVEGYTDVIMSHQAGVENVVATSGTALTPYQLKGLKRYSDNLTTSFDMDIAGDSATKKGIDLAQAKEFNIKVALMPEGLDPADIASKNPGEWRKIIEGAVSIISFYFQSAFSRFDSEDPEGKREISRLVLPAIKRISNDIERDFWIQELARKLKVKETAIASQLGKTKNDRIADEDVQEEKKIPRKSREDLLEEELLALTVKEPKILDRDFFDVSLLSEEARLFLDCVKKGEKDKAFKEKEDYFAMKAEVEYEGIDPEEEAGNCLTEIRKIKIKKGLAEVSSKIKEAENSGDFDRAEKLKEEFSVRCRELASE